MVYLLVNHVPFGLGPSPGTFAVGDLWLEDLRAQATAIRAAGFALRVATPCVQTLTPGAGGSFNTVTVTPADHGFEYVPLPHYKSLKAYVSVRGDLRARLRAAIAPADVVQAGYGGHPVPLGAVAWPLARALGRKRIWVFDGADPFPRMELHASHERNPIKRWAKQLRVRRFADFCRAAIRDADLVFAHNAAVVDRFRDVWDATGARCHAFDRSFVTDGNLVSDEELARAQERLRDDARPLRLVVAGRQIAIKGTDHVLRALAAARSRGADVGLDILGDGDDLATFKSLAAELGLREPVVRFRGTVPYGRPLFDIWAEAHVMVVTNLTAEISRNVLLGMARAMPLVMYRNPGTDRIVEASGAGLLVPTGDVDALAGAFIEAHRDRARLADMAARGVAMARQNTLDATHRRRAELARGLVAPRGAAA
jgi:glycosyltransferase involved in cell wall biosynthesis